MSYCILSIGGPGRIGLHTLIIKKSTLFFLKWFIAAGHAEQGSVI